VFTGSSLNGFYTGSFACNQQLFQYRSWCSSGTWFSWVQGCVYVLLYDLCNDITFGQRPDQTNLILGSRTNSSMLYREARMYFSASLLISLNTLKCLWVSCSTMWYSLYHIPLGWRWRNYTENTSTKISCYSLIEHSSVHIHLLCMCYCSVYTGMALVLYHGGTPI